MKEIILVEECVKRVSIPSELLLEAGLSVMRGGRVNERRPFVLKEAERTRSKPSECAGEDMVVEGSLDHRSARAADMRDACNRAGDVVVVAAAG